MTWLVAALALPGLATAGLLLRLPRLARAEPVAADELDEVQFGFDAEGLV